jgi:hypothetical protein
LKRPTTFAQVEAGQFKALRRNQQGRSAVVRPASREAPSLWRGAIPSTKPVADGSGLDEGGVGPQVCLAEYEPFGYIPRSANLFALLQGIVMKTLVVPVSMICCLYSLFASPFVAAEEPKERFVKVTLGVEADGLEQIPLVGPLLKYLVPQAAETCSENEECCVETQACCNDKEECCGEEIDTPPGTCRRFRVLGFNGVERIGVDFECPIAGPCAACQQAACGNPSEPAQAAVNFDAAANPIMLVTLLEAREEARNMLEDAVNKFRERESELLEKLFEIKLTAAVQEATLKARDESDAKQSALLEALIAAQIENAKLQAKVEAAEEKARLSAELQQARAELASLKQQSESAERIAQPRRSRNNYEARRAETLR